MKDEAEVLWRMYQENCTQGRHHESQRSTATNIMLVLSSALLSAIGWDKSLTRDDWPLTIFLCLVGIFGATLSLKHYERFKLHMERARIFRDKLEEQVPATELKKCKGEADQRHYDKWPRSVFGRLYWLWIALHISVVGLGLLLTIMALTKCQ